MANVIKFPKQPGTFNKLDPVLRSPQATKAKPGYANGILKLFWVIGVLAWPLIKMGAFYRLCHPVLTNAVFLE
jgi:hypothetical protein